jgi:hypothetical protein
LTEIAANETYGFDQKTPQGKNQPTQTPQTSQGGPSQELDGRHDARRRFAETFRRRTVFNQRRARNGASSGSNG